MLKLREKYEGVIISRTIPGVGTITFDPFKVKQSQYQNFIEFGFDFIFENVILKTEGRKNSVTSKIEKADFKAIKEVENYAKTK